MFDGFIRYIATKFSIRQLQHFIGTTKDAYSAWCAQVKQEPYVEAIGESANLLWIGERTLDKVILYFHGESASFGVLLMTYSWVVGPVLNAHCRKRWCIFVSSR